MSRRQGRPGRAASGAHAGVSSHRIAVGESWIAKALISTISGLMFSIVLAISLLGLQRIVPALQDLEQRGIDIGMWFFVRHIAERQEPDANGANAAGLQYVFVDVDIPACKAFGAKGDLSCEVANPINSEMVFDFVRAMKEAGAKVVIVDVQLDPADKELGNKLAGMDKAPWIIVPPNARPADVSDDGFSLHASQSAQIAPIQGIGCLRFAPPVALHDSAMADGVLRRYPIGLRLSVDGALRGWVPTMPYLAALLARNDTEAQAAQHYGPFSPEKKADPETKAKQIECGGHAVTATATPVSELGEPPLFGLPINSKPELWRILYSLPGLTLMGDTDDGDRAEMNRVAHLHASHYQYLRACGLLDQSCPPNPDGSTVQKAHFATRADLFAGRIVLLGSSLPSALDHVQTPVGPMSGGELVLNATRSFADFRRLRDDPPLDEVVGKKIASLGLPALVMFVTWGCIHLSRSYIEARPRSLQDEAAPKLRRRIAIDLAGRTGVVAIFLCGMTIAAFCETFSLAHELRGLQEPGDRVYAVDVLLPVLAMGLEGYAEAAKTLADFFERLAASLVHRARRIFAGSRIK